MIGGQYTKSLSDGGSINLFLHDRSNVLLDRVDVPKLSNRGGHSTEAGLARSLKGSQGHHTAASFLPKALLQLQHQLQQIIAHASNSFSSIDSYSSHTPKVSASDLKLPNSCLIDRSWSWRQARSRSKPVKQPRAIKTLTTDIKEQGQHLSTSF